MLVPGLCRFECEDCPVRLPRSRATEPHSDAVALERIAHVAVAAFRRGLCDGIFLMVGVPEQPVAAMARLLTLVELLRRDHGYRGYLHVKLVDGAEPGQLERRVSFNLESACVRALHEFTGVEPSVAREVEPRAAAALHEARSAAGRAAPVLVTARDRSFVAGHPANGKRKAQASLFEDGGAANALAAAPYRATAQPGPGFAATPQA
jgi:predicted DNA-binding helix-hairpin-helix protein